ncbi:thiol-disulfide oxidoreductase DCC family protein [Adhaeribacter sp. BT258]|uniref:Thiol-disulfide oxidoreductase DCC family protein n=2 Tax=Adhaeribacter terrigena TaxID=2793070 RepID=A0ABS1C5X0_9BACT|nr:thiol-disulfide oxidoreductase DCC family protein [Adhaeribacter terrigena]
MTRQHAIIFFDGVCNLCNGFVQFVIERDPEGYFQFASLQSEAAQPYLKKFQLDENALSSVVLVENGKCYTQSSAALRILKKLSGGWPLLFAGILIPRFLRDGLYNFIARNRYRWFGKQESCWLPTPALKQRFLS